MQPGARPEIGIRRGDLIADKYRVDRILGVGGMGVVVAARHLGLDELVAIKVLLPEALADADAVQRFEREALAAVKIKSEHVTRIIDVGSLDSGAPYIIMEYLAGEDLADRIGRTGALAVDDAVVLLMQACEAIAEAHALGIVHRDLKPANLFCVQGADGRSAIKVLDFGISKLTRTDSARAGLGMTKTRAVMGSPYYMSPEQMESPRKVDARTDIWSLGVVLHQMLTGDVPFNGETLPQVCVNVATRPPPLLRKSRPDVPSGLEAIVLRCLEKDASKRFQTIGALATALARFGPRRAQVSLDRIMRISRQADAQYADAARPHDARAASDRPVTGPLPSWGRTAKSPERRRRSVIGSMAALGVISAGFTFAFVESSTRHPVTEVLITPPRAGEPREVANEPPSARTVEAPALADRPTIEIPASPNPEPSAPPTLQTGPGADEPALGANRSKLAAGSAPPPDPRHLASPPSRPSLVVPATEANPYAPEPEVSSTAALGPNCLLNLNSLPPARVVLDGMPLGFTPRVGIKVEAGEHVVLFRGPDNDKRINVSCAKGESKTVGVRFSEPSPSDDLPEKNPYR